MNVRLSYMTAVLALSAITLQLFGGHPPWPPRKHSAEYRQANMLFLRFQDALASERWQDALSFCSDRVRAKAAEWPSPKAFFNDTLPIQFVLAQDFGYWTLKPDQTGSYDWTDKSNWYGLVVTLTEPESKPVVQWYWAITARNLTWAVDYPPVKLHEYIAKKKAEIQERDEKIEQIRRGLEPKLKDIQTHLIPVSERFVIGSPMVFRVELVNSGSTAVHYQNAGVGHHPLSVLNEKREPLPSHEEPAQIGVGEAELAADGSAVLAGSIDLRHNYEITKPGKYYVQFNGRGLEIGQPVPLGKQGFFGETEGFWPWTFIAALTNFPSNLITIEVTAGREP